jgi:LysR family glycine cleavage system transcriptional activator
MSDNLPPLAALRAFEAAARLENFSRAADEIHVTHGAVSHQVRALEAFVGRPLFTRQGRGVVLTSDGRVLGAAIRTALDQIANAARTIRRRAQTNRLSISTLPSFGSRWLMPRIVRFMSDHPGWAINIDSTPNLVDFSRDDTDIALRFGGGGWPGVHSEWLMDDEYILVASPRLNGGRLPKKPAQLVDFPLIRSDAEPWHAWCQAAGVDIAVPMKGIGYEDMGVMLQVAIDGQGIMLTRRTIAEFELEKGTLVQLFGIATPAHSSYWIVRPEEEPASERVAAFREWLITEAAATRAKSRPSKTRTPRRASRS